MKADGDEGYITTNTYNLELSWTIHPSHSMEVSLGIHAVVGLTSVRMYHLAVLLSKFSLQFKILFQIRGKCGSRIKAGFFYFSPISFLTQMIVS